MTVYLFIPYEIRGNSLGPCGRVSQLVPVPGYSSPLVAGGGGEMTWQNPLAGYVQEYLAHKNPPPLGPYNRTIPGVLGGPRGGGGLL